VVETPIKMDGSRMGGTLHAKDNTGFRLAQLTTEKKKVFVPTDTERKNHTGVKMWDYQGRGGHIVGLAISL